MSKAKQFPYVIYYRDQTFQTINITKADFDEIASALTAGHPFANLSIGLLGLADMRSLFERIEPTGKPEEEEQPVDEEIYPGLSLEEQAYIWEQKQIEESFKKKQNTEVDYS